MKYLTQYLMIPLQWNVIPEMLINSISRKNQYAVTLLLVSLVAIVCYLFSDYIGYRVVAFVLLVTVSLIAMSFDILPVFVAAILSALIWDFFFIPPRFNFHVNSSEDVILLIMYFIIAMVSAVLTHKIRKIEKQVTLKEEKANIVKLYNTVLNSLSHELRTPIAAIVGATDNLQNNDSRLTQQNRQELLAEISKASFRLNQQVENLLNMSRLESGFIQPKKDWCDINELVYTVLDRVEENKPQQKINLTIQPAIPLVKSDKGMLEEIIYNLINNALQYTPPTTTVKVDAHCADNGLILIIADNGPGFPADRMDKVFDKFYRLNNPVTGGTGLGLSIVKGFTEALGGSVSLSNLPDCGAKFIINIPVETSDLSNLP